MSIKTCENTVVVCVFVYSVEKKGYTTCVVYPNALADEALLRTVDDPNSIRRPTAVCLSITEAVRANTHLYIINPIKIHPLQRPRRIKANPHN